MMTTPATDANEQQQQQQIDALDRSPFHVKFSEDNCNTPPRTSSITQDDASSASKQGLY